MLVSAALVAAFVSPAALVSAAPAFADSTPPRITSELLTSLEKAQSDASTTLRDANGALAAAKADFETVKNDPNQFERVAVKRAKDTAEKTAAAAAETDREAEAAALAFGAAKPEDLDKARERMLAADKAANEARAADTKAQAAVTAAQKAYDDMMAGWTAKIAKLEDAEGKAAKAYQDANKAYADAKAAYDAQQQAEQNEKPGDKPAEQPAEKSGAVTPVSNTTSTSTNKGTGTAVKAATTTGSPSELAETGSNPATSYLALGSGLALSLGAAALYVSRRQQARSTS
ncbi:LAETG motif-containing sortase-dependent surface protein [Kitasatospora sp. NPDC101183]|uniref:LAETG motif-containing sortase-dependent surface protein n=1 Tax=Kitasatospora sp. NPDC101183 TaxID=3364100 RepID=UPI0038139D81